MRCRACNKEFTTNTNTNRKFCGRSCAGRSMGKINLPKAWKAHFIKRMPAHCIQCNSIMLVKPFSSRKFCSKSCASKYLHKSETPFGYKGHKHSLEFKLFMGAVTRRRNIENWKNEEYRVRMSNILRKQSHRAASEAMKVLLTKNPRLIRNGEGFLSYEEYECYKFLLSMGLNKEEINHNFPVNGYYVDFFPLRRFFWEHHPCDWVLAPESKDEYFAKRRKMLDENGYANVPLEVTTSIKEIDVIKNLIELWRLVA